MDNVYTVKEGDTLSEIAQNYGLTTQSLVDHNDIGDMNLIVPGQILSIPKPASFANIKFITKDHQACIDTLKDLQEQCHYGSPWWIKIETCLNPSNPVLHHDLGVHV